MIKDKLTKAWRHVQYPSYVAWKVRITQMIKEKPNLFSYPLLAFVELQTETIFWEGGMSEVVKATRDWIDNSVDRAFSVPARGRLHETKLQRIVEWSDRRVFYYDMWKGLFVIEDGVDRPYGGLHGHRYDRIKKLQRFCGFVCSKKYILSDGIAYEVPRCRKGES